MKKQPIYFPGLNGLRAIAAIAVVISHITLALKDFNLNPFIFGMFEDGKPKGISLSGYGVSIFFVLSGFLITYLLQAEKEVQTIDIKKFYWRRILRIWPLYYLYLAIAVIVIIYTTGGINKNMLMLYVFYSPNIPFIMGVGLPLVAHYWSLGVEEQFYLFWPWVNKKFTKYLLPGIIIAIVLLIVVKCCCHFLMPNSIIEAAIHVTRFHCMLIGAFGAILYKRNHSMFLQLTDNKITQTICWIIIVLLAVNRFHVASVIDNEIVAVVGLCLIIGQIQVRNRMVNLEVNLFDYLGKISYGIYVIHPLLIVGFSKVLGDSAIADAPKYLMVYSSILAATIFVGTLLLQLLREIFYEHEKEICGGR